MYTHIYIYTTILNHAVIYIYIYMLLEDEEYIHVRNSKVLKDSMSGIW